MSEEIERDLEEKDEVLTPEAPEEEKEELDASAANEGDDVDEQGEDLI